MSRFSQVRSKAKRSQQNQVRLHNVQGDTSFSGGFSSPTIVICLICCPLLQPSRKSADESFTGRSGLLKENMDTAPFRALRRCCEPIDSPNTPLECFELIRDTDKASPGKARLNS